MRRRSTLEMQVSVLKAVSLSNKPTHVMFNANLSWKRSVEICKELENMKLLHSETVGSRRRLYLTDAGKKELKQLEKLYESCSILPAMLTLRVGVKHSGRLS